MPEPSRISGMSLLRFGYRRAVSEVEAKMSEDARDNLQITS